MKKRSSKHPAPKSAKPAAKGERPTTEAKAPSPFTSDARLPKPGSVIERPYKGKTLKLKVLESAFELDGKEFRSLSSAAQHATKAASINGFLFWKLIPARAPASKKPAEAKAKKAASEKGRKAKAPAPTQADAPTDKKETR